MSTGASCGLPCRVLYGMSKFMLGKGSEQRIASFTALLLSAHRSHNIRFPTFFSRVGLPLP